MNIISSVMNLIGGIQAPRELRDTKVTTQAEKISVYAKPPNGKQIPESHNGTVLQKQKKQFYSSGQKTA